MDVDCRTDTHKSLSFIDVFNQRTDIFVKTAWGTYQHLKKGVECNNNRVQQ